MSHGSTQLSIERDITLDASTRHQRAGVVPATSTNGHRSRAGWDSVHRCNEFHPVSTIRIIAKEGFAAAGGWGDYAETVG